jgi:transposase
MRKHNLPAIVLISSKDRYLRTPPAGATTIHALTDDIGWPLAFLVTQGNTRDLVGARDLIGMVRSPLADRAYDARSLRDELAARRKAAIAPNPTRKHPHRYDKPHTKAATSLIGCSAGSRTSAVLQLDMTSVRTSPPAILLAAAITWWIN